MEWTTVESYFAKQGVQKLVEHQLDS
jgi:DNA-directed RNA polymerase II subunit RPB2